VTALHRCLLILGAAFVTVSGLVMAPTARGFTGVDLLLTFGETIEQVRLNCDRDERRAFTFAGVLDVQLRQGDDGKFHYLIVPRDLRGRADDLDGSLLVVGAASETDDLDEIPITLPVVGTGDLAGFRARMHVVISFRSDDGRTEGDIVTTFLEELCNPDERAAGLASTTRMSDSARFDRVATALLGGTLLLFVVAYARRRLQR
jgi:hypothetical protein